MEKLFLGKTTPESKIQIYFDKTNAEFGKCLGKECKDSAEETEIWSVHSRHDGGFIKLCAYHLLSQLDFGLIKATSEGEIKTLNWAEASFDDLHYQAKLNLFCKKCNCVTLFIGPASRLPYEKKMFSGTCSTCGASIKGLAPALYAEKALLIKKLESETKEI